MRAVVAVLVLVLAVPASAQLTNGSFEEPAAATNWTDTGWTSSGAVWRPLQGARTGEHGVWLKAAAAGEAGLLQDAVVSTGTWTFSGWLKLESGSSPTNIRLELAWKDSATNDLQPAAVADLGHLERDGLWKQVHVTGSCNSSALAFARASLSVQYADATGDPNGILFDNAALYSGAYTGAPFVVNGSFSRGWGETWYGSQWSVVPQGTANSRRTWWSPSGAPLGVLEGWQNAGPSDSYTAVLSQNIYPLATGTWTYTVWIFRENIFLLSNAQLRLEWRDATYTNKVQADTVAPLAIPADNTWRAYAITGTCADANLFEVRAVAEFGYGENTNGYLGIDDVRLTYGGFTNLVVTDHGYFNQCGFDPTAEQVPGTNGLGAFLQVNYARTTTTLYVLGDGGGLARYPDSAGQAGIYVSYQPPDSTNWVTEYSNLTRVATVTLTTNEPFHGLPTNGTLTLDVYRYTYRQPQTNGVPYTNTVKVFYAPFFASYYGSVLEDRQFLVRLDGLVTNDWPIGPQHFHTNQWHKDYFYYHLPHLVQPAFTNAAFEEPSVVVTSWDGYGWQAYGDASRDNWSTHSGPLGAYLPAWFTNWVEDGVPHLAFAESAIFQAVAVTGGACTFSAWLRSDTGVVPNRLEMRLEWYNASGAMARLDKRDLTPFPRDGSWHPVFLSATCAAPDIVYAVPAVLGQFWSRTGFPDRVQVDDAAFYAGSYSGVHALANTGFEEGNAGDFRGSRWYAQPEYLASYRAGWGGRRGPASGVFDSSTTNESTYTTRVSQNTAPGPGTYTFALWILRDVNSLATNTEIRLGWYDATLTNRVQGDSVSPFVAPADNAWREVHVTGTCNDPDLYEVRATVMAQYDATGGTSGTTLRMDDARFFRGDYVEPLILDWGYFGASNSDPSAEGVPGAGAPFFRVDYARTTTTFYVLANHPTIAPDTNTTGVVGMRTAFWNTLITNWADVQTAMTFAGTAELSDAGRFHGSPAAGTVTVDVYRYGWTQPLNATGGPMAGPVTVWFCPYLRTFSGTSMAENLWMLRRGEMPNNYADSPQLFGDSYFHKDYCYTNLWTPDQDADSLPDLWELGHFDEITNCDPLADSDGDTNNNLDEYVADTRPMDNGSYFRGRITARTGTVVCGVRVDSPTTNSRLYDVWWKTNLVNAEPWVRYGFDVPGDPAGGDLWLPVTNSPGMRFYRTGVRLP